MLIPILRSLVFSLFLVGYLVSCDDSDSKKKSDNITRRRTISTLPPASYALDDPECQKQAGNMALKSTNVWQWIGFQVASELTPLRLTGSQESLYSNIVSQTRYNRKYLRSCDGTKSRGLECAKENSNQETGYTLPPLSNNLRICKDAHAYKRNSYEGAGLTSLHFLNNAANVYQQVSGKALPRITLDVFAHFETLMENRKTSDGKTVHEKRWITDNLAYYPGHNLIVVFPQSQLFADKNLDRFWESEFVLAHELGHHIQEQIIGKASRQKGLFWSPLQHGYLKDSSAASHANETARMYTSVSEAFADLTAYYAIGGDLTSLESVTCLGKNRNIDKKLFADLTSEKVLNAEAINRLLYHHTSITHCDDADLSDPHLIGAILAYGLNSIFAVSAPGTRALGTKRFEDEVVNKRYQMTLKWLEVYFAQHNKTSSRLNTKMSTLFDPVSPAIEAAMSGISSAEKSRVCDLSKTIFPALTVQPFNEHCS